MRMPSNVLVFAGDNIDPYKRFKDFVNHHRSINESKNFAYDTSISYEEKADRVHADMIAEIEAKSGTSISNLEPHVAMSHPLVRWATFAVINARIDMILPETIIDSIGLYTDVKFGGFGDSFAFDVEPRDLFAVTVSGRGKRHTDMKRQFKGQVPVLPVEHDVTVYVSLYRVLAGQENLAEFVLKAVQSIETQMTYDAYDAFATAMGALDNTAAADTQLRISGYVQSTAINLAQKVTAWNGGRKAVFVGTQLALSNILPSNTTNFRYMLDSDYVKLGYVQNFNGFDAMVLPQVADYTTPFKLKLDDKKVYIVSPSAQKIIKMCVEGQTIAIQDGVYESANLTQATTLKKNWGTGVATNAIAGVIELA